MNFPDDTFWTAKPYIRPKIIFDILCVQGRPKYLICFLNIINGFILGSHYCRRTARGGGAGIFIKQKIEVQPLEMTNIYVDKSFEIYDIVTKLQMH